MVNGKSLQQKKRTSPSNFTYSIQLRDQIPASTDSFEFLNQINPKKVVSNLKKKKKKEPNKKNHHQILHVQISISSKFQLQQLVFSKKFSKKGYFYTKQEKNNITIEFFKFKLVQVSNFSLN